MACSCETEGARVAAATEPFGHAYPVPEYPPVEWFTERPDWLQTPDEIRAAWVADGGDPLDAPVTKLQVDDQGRIAGYFYQDGQCLVHDPTACPRPSPTRYSAFHQSEVITASGEPIVVGVIGNNGGHASATAPVSVALEHYANPNLQLLACRAYDDDIGGVILGALVPGVTYGDVALVRRSALSGDWRPMPAQWWQAHGIQASVVRACQGYDCIGPTFVTKPGLPLARRTRAAAVEVSVARTIELPDGTKITEHGDTAPLPPPGPHVRADIDETPAVEAAEAILAQARQAANPPPPPPGGAKQQAPPPGGQKQQAPPGAQQPSSGGDVNARLDALEKDVEGIKNVLGQLIDQLTQPMAAAAQLPEREPDPKA